MKVIITETQLKEIKKILKENPNNVVSRNGGKTAGVGSSDSLAFTFIGDRAYIGLNDFLFWDENNTKIPEYKQEEMASLSFYVKKYYYWHIGIGSYYDFLGEKNKLQTERSLLEYPGRIWYDRKIISFWKYPKKEQMGSLLNSLSSEISRLYGVDIDFSDYSIDVTENGGVWDDDRNEPGKLIPLNQYENSKDATPEEMAKMHLLPSDEKQNTPQMKASLDAKYKNIGDKLGIERKKEYWDEEDIADDLKNNGEKHRGVTQAEYNHYKKYGMGESTEIQEDIHIPVTTGDTVLMGKFKNKKTVVKIIGKDEYNMPTINGKKAATFRMTEDSSEIGRSHIDWDSNYGKSFRVVSTPKGAESGGNWDKDLISIVTPENGDSWDDWVEVPFNILTTWKNNWENIQKSLEDYKYNQIIRCSQKMNEVLEKDVNLDSFEIKKELNSKFWTDKKLNSKVRKRLLKIADDFLEFVNVDSKYCKDILFLGSLANYNWSKYSDIDLHLVVDFKKINTDVELVKDYFDTKRKLWGLEHESLKIYGFPVELYIQDTNETNFSTGEFSLEKNKWTRVPKEDQEELLNVNKIKQKSADIMTKIDDLKSKYNKKTSVTDIEDISNKVKSLFDNIKKLRKVGLESKNSEFSVGNIVFKVLRRSGHMETLVDLKRDTYDKINTIK